MNELTLDGKTYVSSKRAAEITGYAKDYVGQLCREGHVEARLVGRNWYVLESSIKAHRFGGDSTEAAVEMPTQSWPKAKYIAEEPPPLPVFTPMASEEVKAVVPTQSESPSREGTILTDMESAWGEWFTKKQEEVPEEEVVMEEIIEDEPETSSPEIVEEDAENTEEQTPVTVIHIDTPSHGEVLDLAHEEPEEARVIEERVVTRRRRRPLLGNLAIQSAFIGTALIVAALAVVGTGYAQRIIGTSLYRLPEINFIAGVSEINR